MRFDMRKTVSVIMTVVMLCGMLVGMTTSVSAEAKDLFSGGETSRMDMENANTMALAFRFQLRTRGASHYRHALNIEKATVVPIVGGDTYNLKAVGTLICNDATYGTEEIMVRDKVTEVPGNRLQDIATKQVVEVTRTTITYVTRIVNIPLSISKERLLFARPYYVYEDAQGNDITVYGDIAADNLNGTHRQYNVDIPDLGWTAGMLNRTTGKELASDTAVRTAFIHNFEGLIKLPGNTRAYAYYYSSDRFLFRVAITGEAVKTEELEVPEEATCVRFVAYHIDGTPMGTLAQDISIKAMKGIGMVPLAFYSGALTVDTGAEEESNIRIRTNYLPVEDVLIYPENSDGYVLYFYDADKNFISCGNAFVSSAQMMKKIKPEGAVYYRIMARGGTGQAIGSYVPMCASNVHVYLPSSPVYQEFVDDYVTPEENLTHDVPENQGVKNALLNMEQLIKISYIPKAPIPQTIKTIAAGVNHSSIPYSSTRVDAAYVPNNVSFHTFMTAVQNPNSYLYTVDMNTMYGNVNGKTYYGTVCSTSVGYALGIVPNYTTGQWVNIPDMMLLPEQSAYELKLCDTVVGLGHVVMITDIVRDEYNEIVQITISESAGAGCHSRTYTIDEFIEKYPTEHYEYCRYTKLADVQHTPSPFVTVGDEMAQSVVYNTAIIPRKGDKANWRTSEDVVLDVLRPGNFTQVAVYKDDTLAKTVDIASVITLSDLAPGSYKARLTDGTNYSAWCYWIVTDATSHAATVIDGPTGLELVSLTFSATNAEPLYTQFMNKANATVYIVPLSEKAKENGTVKYRPTFYGDMKVRVAFQTEYGIVFSELPESIYVHE